MSADELENTLLAQVRPVFPQLSENLIRNAIKVVREGDATNGETVASLLPICIDFLLDMPLETGEIGNLQHATNGMGMNLATRYEKNGDSVKIEPVGSCNGAQNHSSASAEGIQSALLNSDDSFDDLARSITRGNFDAKMRDVKDGFSSSSPSPKSSSSRSSHFSSDVVSNNEDRVESGNELSTVKTTRPIPSSTCDRPSKNGTIDDIQRNGTPTVHQISSYEEACETVVGVLSISFYDF